MSRNNSIKRQDGREIDEIREISIAFNQLDRADGSAKFAFGSLASFSGPMEVRLQKDQATRATLEVVHRPLEGIGATPSRAIESSLQSLLPPLLNLGQHPRSLIQLIVQSLSPTKLPSTQSSTYSYSSPAPEIDLSQRSWPAAQEDDGAESDEEIVYQSSTTQKPAPTTSIPFSSRASGINATALSILSAGSLALSAIPIAVALAVLPTTSGSSLVVDPTMEEEVKATARFGFAWAVSSAGSGNGGGMDVDEDELNMELVWVESEGSVSRSEFNKAMEMSKDSASEIWGVVREAAAEHVSKTVR